MGFNGGSSIVKVYVSSREMDLNGQAAGKPEALKMKDTPKIPDNYLEQAAENLNIVEVLAYIFSEKAKSKWKRAYEKQIQMSGFPIKKAHFENRLPDKLKVPAKHRVLLVDETGCLPMDIHGASLFFRLIARRYEKHLPSLPPTRLSPGGTRFLPTSPSPLLSWTAS